MQVDIRSELTKSDRFIGIKISGFTLIELLIALLVLSIGLLGIIKLILMSKQFTHQAIQRSQAITIAESIVERIKANPRALFDYSLALIEGNAASSSAPSPSCTGSSLCNINQLATFDLWALQQSFLVSGLNQALACFSFNAKEDLQRSGLLTLKIQWQGLFRLSDAVSLEGDNCNPTSANSDPFRRQVEVKTYVIDETEL